MKGKYQFGLIDDAWKAAVENQLVHFPSIGRFKCWVRWLLRTYVWNEGKDSNNSYQSVRESWCPSAMVDLNGVLYAVTFTSMEENRGPKFRISKFTPESDNTITPKIWNANLWYTVFRAHSDYWLNLDKTGCYPKFEDKEEVPEYHHVRNSLHNAFSPTIAQETASSNHIYVLGWFPPTRYGDATKDTEGLFICKIRKSDFDYTSFGGTIWENSDPFKSGVQPLRTSYWGDKLQPEWGNYKAVYAGKYLQIYNIINKSSVDEAAYGVSTKIHYRFYQTSVLLKTDFEGDIPCDTCPINKRILYSRFQRIGNTIYFGNTEVTDHQILWECNTDTNTINRKIKSTYFQYPGKYHKLGSISSSASSTRYQNDFCILQHNGKQIFCTLGLKAGKTEQTKSGLLTYPSLASDLTANYGWDKDTYTYINWDPQTLVCILCSYELPSTNDNDIKTETDLRTYAQNVIYNIPIIRGKTGVDGGDTTAADDKRLYLNTQMFVPYTADSGRNYFIYAYCYPGRTPKLYLGYAPYYIASDNHVRLLPKCEFTPFDNFTSCSRIISMDLKSGHLWITFMNSDSTAYYYFHILASDLVGE